MSRLPAPGVDRDIYPMPMFVTLPVRDLESATRWYEALGFVVLATLPGPDGPDSLVHLRRQRYQDLLLVRGTPTPGPRITVAAGDDDLTARADHLRRFAGAGEGSVEGPLETPWFTRDVVAADADGYVVVLTAPRFEDIAANPEWTRTVVDSIGRSPGGPTG